MNRDATTFRIYEEALSLEGADRDRFLATSCEGDPALRAEVDALLEAAETADEEAFLAAGPLSLMGVLDEAAASRGEPERRTGERIGRYRLSGVLGEGGFGTVYRARQEEPVERDVAIKVIRGTLAGDAVVRRFQAERQVLARLQHPGIAQMLDAGTDADGTPYMVMELVSGEPVTRYCAQQTLDLAARLRLFVRVCEALEHAHQKGVIHRDLKPSNVLVETASGDPRPKIIDFGIALVVEDALEKDTRLTRGGLMGSPETMAPEQVAGERDLDTRTDIYGLGVLLYELLCGRSPFRDDDASLVELLRRITEEEPVPPSAVDRALPRELDWIVLRAMAKDRAERYPSATALADDIRSYLSDRPISAHPPGMAYLARKFARRHAVGVVAGTLVLATLVAGVVGTSIGLVRAHREAENARETVALLQEFLAAPDPEAQGRDLRVVELLEAFEPRLAELADRPALHAELLFAYATTYRGLGLYEDALAPARAAAREQDRLYGAGDARTLASTNLEAQLLLELDRSEPAMDLAEAARNRARDSLGPDDPVTLALAATLADAHHRLGAFEAADALYTDTLARLSRTRGEDHDQTLRLLHRHALNLLHLGRPEEAESVSRLAFERAGERHGAEHPQTLNAWSELALVLGESGQYDEAGEIHQALVEARARVLGDAHRKTLVSMTNLAWIRARQGDYEAAVRLNRQVLALQEEVLGVEHRNTIATQANLAMALARTGALEEAEQLMGEALASRERLLGPDHPETLVALNDMLVVYARQQKYTEAAAMAERLVAKNRVIQGDRHPATLGTLNNLGWLLNRLERPAEALPVLEEAYAGRAAVLGEDHPATLGTRQLLADVLVTMERRAEAVAHFEDLVRLSEQALGEDHAQTLARRERLAALTLEDR